ncbi:phosphoribosylformylglycinamidine synthase [Marinicella litoralis]|uniref:Phosphoribosylformylglycinamidine synthase n=1 Tax=Marinicella litoralis TaxID=644220 RepID=A0A4R6XMB2_9GAMM|nr:phosphoribosylformylglycinamidine synthase [Marinicella litoralis]TDR20795.1 phosphoribosylformylglycinamidine synthase [Marinicella litoralis]
MTFHLHTFIGSDVYSAFRVEKLNHSLTLGGGTTQIIKAKHFYVVEAAEQLNDLQIIQIEKLLSAANYNSSLSQVEHLIMPRPGTISPWSTKATDIFHHSGLTAVNRVETGRLLSMNNTDAFEHNLLLDRMTESLYGSTDELNQLFDHQNPGSLTHVAINKEGKAKLQALNLSMGLALSEEEIDYLYTSYQKLGKSPTDVELMMFAQANSEHCRHKIFNADWRIDDVKQDLSLFKMIKNTEKVTTAPALSAYKDNAAVFSGGSGKRMTTNKAHQYQEVAQEIDVLIKVETHNHPTGIEPFAGAATGSGGEIRDEAATGQGAKPKAGLCGFSVSHLHIPNHQQRWETQSPGTPGRMATSFEIMQKGPIGAAAFNNEFGRPNICGYFRNFEYKTTELNQWRGYHKPIMLAGGMGHVNHIHTTKQDTLPGDYVVVLGGPAMLIGLGGGAASSISSADGQEDLDFASVQRGNPEMQRRCQEVIDRCWFREQESPIRSIHDVGAGGLSNAIPEILDDAGLGGEIELRRLQIDHVSMTPMEIWCNESQERYVLSIKPEKLAEFELICARERCPFALMGTATKDQKLILNDELFNNKPVDIPMDLLFGNTPKTEINIQSNVPTTQPFKAEIESLKEQVEQVLSFPAVASKKYLITIGDRTVSGLIHRDQMVGPWQVPVADCAITLRDYQSYAGEAMAVGERTPLALLNPAASARIAVTEAITNLMGLGLSSMNEIKLSANWMAASSHKGEYQALYEAVKAIGMELCPELSIGIPVGKDSMSMQTQWNEGQVNKQVTSPMSLIISAFTAVKDVRKHLTPQLSGQVGNELLLIDLGNGKRRMGGSILYQVQNQMGVESPDLDEAKQLLNLFDFMHEAIEAQLIQACHDRSDGGLLTTMAEMSFAGHCGVQLTVEETGVDVEYFIFNEEPGLVIEVVDSDSTQLQAMLKKYGLNDLVHGVGVITAADCFEIQTKDNQVIWDRSELEAIWSKPSYLMALNRDNPEEVKQEFQSVTKENPGIKPRVDFDFSEAIMAPYINSVKPKVAILREQGVNGQNEMAAAFMRAGFDCVDVHMHDLISGQIKLDSFSGMAVCGGFSYGDVLGAGLGWAKTILHNEGLRSQFEGFFADESKFTLGVCNGCQMLSGVRSIIPGTENWPDFLRNKSEQFEARYSQLEIKETNNLFFKGMQGAHIPVAIAHGEGRADFAENTFNQEVVAANYIDNFGQQSMTYPFNPNGSAEAVAAVSNTQGNVLVMMPHPERVFRTVQMSWAPDQWGENSPWMRMFYNARLFVN